MLLQWPLRLIDFRHKGNIEHLRHGGVLIDERDWITASFNASGLRGRFERG